jgi:hypothetical protein
MASTGRMSRVHDAYADNSYHSPMSGKAESWRKEDIPWGMTEPPREMHNISPTFLHRQQQDPHTVKQHSPGYAQGRWSHHASGERSEQNTPLRNSFQRDEVGPAPGQVRDPNLHEQYFGVGDEDDLPGPSGGHGFDFEDHGRPQPYYQPDQQTGQGKGPTVHEEERGHFV